MTNEIVLLHKTGPERFESIDSTRAFSFMTCLRHIVIAESSHVDDLQSQSHQVLSASEAYCFLLEVVCGLHSPLVGETEVSGQFKAAVGAYQFPATPWGTQLAKTFKTLFEDAKKVRDAHLKDLGSQSYGSVLRREVRGLKSLHILGAGHLVQEILPWVMKDRLQITVHCRDVVKAEAELALKLDAGQLARVRVVSLGDRAGLTTGDALVIAAPVTASWIRSWLPKEADLKFVADLRADSAVDRLAEFSRVLELGEFMSRLSTNQVLLETRKASALQTIAAAALERARSVEYRPFGWEDVCA